MILELDHKTIVDKLFDRFSPAWRCQILECVSSNRTITEAPLCLEKRRPFDMRAEGPPFEHGRGDWRNFKPWIIIEARPPTAKTVKAERPRIRAD